MISLRKFCGRCGSPICILPESKPEVIVICGGSLDEYEKFEPKQETWMKKKREWLGDVKVEGCVGWEESRPLASGRMEEK